MFRPCSSRRRLIATVLLLSPPLALPASAEEPTDPKPVSFMADVAPILVRNCIACHNPKKPESKYVMTSFDKLAKGGKVGEDITLEPGKPDESYLIELIRPEGDPRMPFKQDPLDAAEIALLERWVAEGAKYDGKAADEDWTFLLRRTRKVDVPDSYPVAVPITSVAFTPDNARVEAAGYHEVTAWNVADAALAGRLRELPERTYDVAFSKDGKWMATAGGDPGLYGLAKLYALEPGAEPKLVRDLAEAQDAVFAVAFTPDGSKIATAGADRILRVFDTAKGDLLFQVEDHADWILDIAFSPDGKLLATASRDKSSKVFDVEKKESLVTFPGHGQPVYGVLFAPDGKAVVSAGGDAQVRIWTIDGEAKEVRKIAGFGAAVFAIALTPDGKTLAGAGGDNKVRVYNFEDGKALRTLEGHKDWIYSTAFSPDGKLVASGSWDGEVRLWNLEDGKPLQTFLAAPGFKPPGDQAAR
ncbi:c-type cytochrome domain-containing protein [Planctomyces sp. SH-PL62]|uniref:c-type cytochrome domain-containing protein n=1 Tax=Planctomyces sp. SH-PL62 TaxID=1636152 RepID=UPI00078BFD25|nr:c-type cytochrome domain-containing protein [Planctomyces sp. SH-PL62]AMV38632.1 translocation protein TolB [Planctomyces sp. SH-PL62]